MLAVLSACSSGDRTPSGTAAQQRTARSTATAPTRDSPLPCEITPAGAASPPATVTLWHSFGTVAEAVLTELAERFHATEPGVTVKLVKVDSDDLLLKQWRETEPEDRPSLALMPHDTVRLLADSAGTIPVGDCLTRDAPDDLLPAVTGAYEVDGALQAVPFNVSTPVLIYNRYVFESAGLDPDDPPATLDEVRSAAERVEEAGAGVGLVFETGAQGAGSWFVEQWLAQAGELSLDEGNGRSGIPSTVLWDDGPAPGYLAWVRDMVADGLAETIKPESSMAGYVERLVDTDNPAAMTVQTCGSMRDLAELAAAANSPEFVPAVAGLPGPGEGGLAGGKAVFLAAGLPAPETAAAWKLAAFLASAESQATLAARTGYVPIRTGATRVPELADAWSEHPILRAGYDQLAAVDVDPAALGPQAGPERQLKELLAAATSDVIAGADPEEALANSAAAAEGLLHDYARHMAG